MKAEFCGLDRRLDELNARIKRLQQLAARPRADFDASQDLRDIAERNFEVAAQCCIDIAHRVISLEGARKPRDYYESIIRLAEMGVLPRELAHTLAAVAGFRNLLVHEYAGIDWDEVYRNFQRLPELRAFAGRIAQWMEEKTGR